PQTLRNQARPLTGSVPPGTVSLPQLFRNGGYATVSVGKVYHHNNDDPDGWTRRYTETFAESAGYCSGYQLAENQALLPNYFKRRQGPTASLPRPPMWECTDTSDEACPDGFIASTAVEELRRFKASGEPFFLAAGFYRPHLPWTPPRKYWDLYQRQNIPLPANFHAAADSIPRNDWDEVRRYGDAPEQGPVSEDKARQMIHGYYASVSFVDAQIGKVLDELHGLGLDQSTVVLLFGDNGWNLGEHGRWSKFTNYETSTRVTLIAACPGGADGTAHQTTAALVELVDIYPSLCELCGLAAPAYLEGTSFVPLLKEPNRRWKSAAFSSLINDYQTRTMRTDRYRLIEHATGQTELYDHQNDPAEDHNLAGDPASQDILRQLRGALEAGWQAAKPPVADAKTSGKKTP
ncbi:MAG: sulfatase, partial [Thermoguttaceae bacterium]